jgi:hypothetical protein
MERPPLKDFLVVICHLHLVNFINQPKIHNLESPQISFKLPLIDNVPPKLSIVTISPSNYQNIGNISLNDETTLSKKNTKTSKKNIKLKKKLKKKNQKGGKLKKKKKKFLCRRKK